MKKIFVLLSALIMLFSLASCGGEGDPASSGSQSSQSAQKEVGSLNDIIKNIVTKNNLTGGFIYTSESEVKGEYLDEDLISSFYGGFKDGELVVPDFSLIEDYSVYIDYKNPLLYIEVGIFKVRDSKNNSMVTDFLNLRRDIIVERAINYPALDAEPFKEIIIESVGSYTYYVAVKENRSGIKSEIREALGA